jgi:hypothetical protein
MLCILNHVYTAVSVVFSKAVHRRRVWFGLVGWVKFYPNPNPFYASGLKSAFVVQPNEHTS